MKNKIADKHHNEPIFPKGVNFTPVPSPLLGSMLKEISDYDELVCLLRFINLLHTRNQKPKWINQNQLMSDEVLQAVVGSTDDIFHALNKCVARGTILRASSDDPDNIQILVLNSFDAEMIIKRIIKDGQATTFDIIENNNERENIFSLYENNIGALSPFITEELKHAQKVYPAEWIHDAFREAVLNNARSWRYIQSILENWNSKGRAYRDDPNRRRSGQTRRHIKEVGQGTNSRY